MPVPPRVRRVFGDAINSSIATILQWRPKRAEFASVPEQEVGFYNPLSMKAFRFLLLGFSTILLFEIFGIQSSLSQFNISVDPVDQESLTIQVPVNLFSARRGPPQPSVTTTVRISSENQWSGGVNVTADCCSFDGGLDSYVNPIFAWAQLDSGGVQTVFVSPQADAILSLRVTSGGWGASLGLYYVTVKATDASGSGIVKETRFRFSVIPTNNDKPPLPICARFENSGQSTPPETESLQLPLTWGVHSRAYADMPAGGRDITYFSTHFSDLWQWNISDSPFGSSDARGLVVLHNQSGAQVQLVFFDAAPGVCNALGTIQLDNNGEFSQMTLSFSSAYNIIIFRRKVRVSSFIVCTSWAWWDIAVLGDPGLPPTFSSWQMTFTWKQR